MGQLPQPQSAGQAGAAFERVQHTQHLIAGLAVLRPRYPLAQGAAHLRQQLQGLLLEDRKQVGVHRIDDVEVFLAGVVRGGDQIRKAGECACGKGRERRDRYRPQVDWRNHDRGSGRLDGRGFRRALEIKDRDRFVYRTKRHNIQLGKVAQRQVFDQVGALRHFDIGECQQCRSDPRVWIFKEAGGELVQQPANFLRCIGEHLAMPGCAIGQRLRVLERVLQCPGDIRQGLKAHRGRTSRQGMGQPHSGVGQRLVQLHGPLGDLGDQPP